MAVDIAVKEELVGNRSRRCRIGNRRIRIRLNTGGIRAFRDGDLLAQDLSPLGLVQG